MKGALVLKIGNDDYALESEDPVFRFGGAAQPSPPWRQAMLGRDQHFAMKKQYLATCGVTQIGVTVVKL
jgi:hypothetical protein